MKRHIDEELFDKMINDFKFLFEIIKSSKNELDLRLRDNYFNIYYKGNSLAMVKLKQNDYVIKIHNRFISGIYDSDKRFSKLLQRGGKLTEIKLQPKQIHPFLQKKYLDKIASKIKEVNNGEEITFEQMIITDNIDNKDIVIIDRQVTETKLKGRRIDLLGLKKVSEKNFSFVVLEVKLGNNPELKNDVKKQISFYMEHIRNHIQDWADSYQIVYKQLRAIGIHQNIEYDDIKILNEVSGKLLVGGYSGIATKQIDDLKTYSQIAFGIQHFINRITP